MRRLRDDQWEQVQEHFSDEHIPDNRPGMQTHAHAQCAGGGAVDSERWRVAAHADPVLSQLQNPCIADFNNGVNARYCARSSHKLANTLRRRAGRGAAACSVRSPCNQPHFTFSA